MVRVIVVFVSLILACYPAQAVAPAVLIAKEIVKQIIFDFVEARIEDGIRASFGPCKADLAEDAVKHSRTLTGLLRSSGGGMANIGAPGGASSLGGLSNLGAARWPGARCAQSAERAIDSGFSCRRSEPGRSRGRWRCRVGSGSACGHRVRSRGYRCRNGW